MSTPRLFALALLLPLGALGAALVTQYGLDMQPCPWCVLQRVEFAIIGLLALAGLAGAMLGWRLVQAGAALAMLMLAAAGAATALWQHFVAASSTSCNLTLADRIVRGSGLDELLPQVFAPYASCAEAAARLLGVPYEFYSLVLFVVLGTMAWLTLRRQA